MNTTKYGMPQRTARDKQKGMAIGDRTEISDAQISRPSEADRPTKIHNTINITPLDLYA